MNKCKNFDNIYNDELNIIYSHLQNNKCKKMKKNEYKKKIKEQHIDYSHINKLIENSNNLAEHKISNLSCIVKNIFDQESTLIQNINNEIDIINTTLINQGNDIRNIQTTLQNGGENSENSDTNSAAQNQDIKDLQDTVAAQQQEINNLKAFIELTFNYTF